VEAVKSDRIGLHEESDAPVLDVLSLAGVLLLAAATALTARAAAKR
jgi:hypothetical protein